MARQYNREGRPIMYAIKSLDDTFTAYNIFFTFDPDEAEEYRNDRHYEIEELLEGIIECQDTSSSRFSEALERIRQYFRNAYARWKNQRQNKND